ncbi:hypothetical protein D9M71_457070 [compost metagenome]
MLEAQPGERLRAGDEVVEGAVVPLRHQFVPQRLELDRVALADGVLDFAEARAVFQRIGPGLGDFAEDFRQVVELLGVVADAFQVHHGAARGGGQRVGEGLGFQAQLVDVVIEGRARYREAHAAQLGDDALGAFEGLGAQTAAHLRGFVDHRLEAQLHQLVGGYQAGDAGADDGHFGTVGGLRNAAEAGRVLDPVVEGEGEVRAEDGDGLLAVAFGMAILLHWILPAGWAPVRAFKHRPGRKALHGRPAQPACGPMDGQGAARSGSMSGHTIPEGFVEMNPLICHMNE